MPARLRPQTRRDDGAAMVEFAFVGVLLVMLVFGIIVFGLLLSFKQDVTRAAAEGARVGAVAFAPSSKPSAYDQDPRYIATLKATEAGVEGFDQTCGDPTAADFEGMECQVTLHDCNAAPVSGSLSYWDTAAQDCVTVRLVYHYRSHPLILDPPLLSAALPDEISSTSVARLNK